MRICSVFAFVVNLKITYRDLFLYTGAKQSFIGERSCKNRITPLIFYGLINILLIASIFGFVLSITLFFKKSTNTSSNSYFRQFLFSTVGVRFTSFYYRWWISRTFYLVFSLAIASLSPYFYSNLLLLQNHSNR